jgi:hypothetical protein
MSQTAVARTNAPATIKPVVTNVPKKNTTAQEMMPIQARQATAKRTNNLDGLYKEIKIRLLSTHLP